MSEPKPGATYINAFGAGCPAIYAVILNEAGLRVRQVSAENDELLYEAEIPKSAIIAVEAGEYLVTRDDCDYTMCRIYVTVTPDAADPRELEPCKPVDTPIEHKGYWNTQLGDSMVGELVGAKGIIDASAKFPTGDPRKICIFQEIVARNPGYYWRTMEEDRELHAGFQEFRNALRLSMGKDPEGIWII